MKIQLLKDLIDLAEQFDKENVDNLYPNTISGLLIWASRNVMDSDESNHIAWQSKDTGRSAESAISTLLVHLNRMGKMYARAAIQGSDFTSQEDFIFLITLKSFGTLSKTELIRKNRIEKATGMQILTRLLSKGWIAQTDSETDKRSKMISITDRGVAVLEQQMPNIRTATRIVSGNLSHKEKLQLISLLSKLEHFHDHIYNTYDAEDRLLEKVLEEYPFLQN